MATCSCWRAVRTSPKGSRSFETVVGLSTLGTIVGATPRPRKEEEGARPAPGPRHGMKGRARPHRAIILSIDIYSYILSIYCHILILRIVSYDFRAHTAVCLTRSALLR
jgi:hypothetical protein